MFDTNIMSKVKKRQSNLPIRTFAELNQTLHYAFTAVTMTIFRFFISVALVPTSAHSRSFKAKIIKNKVYSCQPKFYCVKVGFERSTLHRRVSIYLNITQTLPMQYAAIFTGCKNDNFQIQKLIFFCSKHKLRVHVRTAS